MGGRQEKQEEEGQRPDSRWSGWADLQVKGLLSQEGAGVEMSGAPLTPTKLRVLWVENEAWSRTWVPSIPLLPSRLGEVELR